MMATDAKIIFKKTHTDQGDVITCEWQGGKFAGIADELMADIKADARVGDELEIGGLRIVILAHSLVDGAWYVRQADN